MSAPGARDGSGGMFDAIAERYDLLNRIISFGIDRRWRARTIAALELTPGARLLDLATGTGDLALLAARRHPGISVVGLDPSANMLAIAATKAGGLPLGLVRGDAERLPFADATVDRISMGFGIRNVPDRPRALREMARVLRPGGRVAILELSEPDGRFLGAAARFHVHRVVPWVGSALSGSREYRYLSRSIAAFPPAGAFAETMRASGLEVVSVEPLTFGVATLFVARRPA